MTRKIVERVSDEVLQHDLEQYRQRALDLGATDAKIIPTDAKVTGDPIRFTLPQFVVDYNDLLKITHSDVVYSLNLKLEIHSSAIIAEPV